MAYDKPVLVLTGADDPTADVVIDELNHRSLPLVRLDPADVLHGGVGIASQFDEQGLAGCVQTRSRRLELASVRSVYYRRPSSFVAPLGMSAQDGRFAKEEAKHGMGGILAGIQARWVNHIWRSLEAEFKPTQLSVAGRVGFKIPPTIITNNLDDVRRFAKDHGKIVYKPLQNSELRDPLGSAMAIWVDEVDDQDLDESIATTLQLFQARVPKVADVRLTMIGTRAFSVRIDSPYVDWRRDYDQVSYSVIETPSSVLDACHRYLAWFGLLFGAFDFALGEDGSWTWYECNTGGQWHWLELETGLPMTRALADLLEIR